MSYIPGDWLAICDRCGFKFHASKLRKTWDGLMVDAACFETRNPQDLMRPIKDDPSVPWTRADADSVTTSDGMTAVVDVGPSYIAESVGSQDRTIPAGTNDGSL